MAHLPIDLLPHMPILGSSNSAANKDMMSNILTNGDTIQFSDWVENIVGKEEIACYEQFLLFPKCFQKLSVLDALKWVWRKENNCANLFWNPSINIEIIVWTNPNGRRHARTYNEVPLWRLSHSSQAGARKMCFVQKRAFRKLNTSIYWLNHWPLDLRMTGYFPSDRLLLYCTMVAFCGQNWFIKICI